MFFFTHLFYSGIHLFSSLLGYQAPGIWDIVYRTTCVYFFLVGALRVLGKKHIGQSSLHDLVLILVLANAVQNAMVGDNNTLAGGIVAASVVLFWNWLLNVIGVHWRRFDHLIAGIPTTLVSNGQIHQRAMRKEQVTERELLGAIHLWGLDSIEQCRLVILETNGAFTVFAREEFEGRIRPQR